MSAPEISFNPFEPGFTDDPYPAWASLRAHEPVHQTPLGFWVLTRYDDVLRFVRDPATSVEEGNARPNAFTALAREVLGDREARGDYSMLSRDPPDHTRLRRLVSKAFTPRTIERLRPRVEQLVDDALDRVAATGSMEVIADLAFPLPFAVISEMLGMPDTDATQLRHWSGLVVRTLEPIADLNLLREIAVASDAMDDFLTEVIAWKRRSPGDDLLSALIAAEENGDVLSDEELVAQVALLYIAGHETTVNLIGNGTLALLRDRDQLARLRNDPSLDANAVEELLRYDSPVQMTRRITVTDVDVSGRRIEEGTFVICVLASANRDETRWGPTAAALDVARKDAHEHVSFGGGVHYCLGSALARLEGQVAIGRLIRRFAHLELAEEPMWNGRINLRGLERLPLAVG